MSGSTCQQSSSSRLVPPPGPGRLEYLRRKFAGEIVENGDGTFREANEADRAEAARRRDEERRERDEDRRREEQAEARQRSQSLWEHSEVPPRFLEADLDRLGDVPAKYFAVATMLKGTFDSPGINALIGRRGPGKTFLACGLIRHFCRRGRSAKYVTAMKIFRSIRETWGAKRGGEKEADFISELSSVGLLVIDEMQVRAESAWENNVLTDIIDSRYAYFRPTLLIGNLEPNALAANLGDSIASRLIETGKIIVCDWPSFRTAGKTQSEPRCDATGRLIWPPISVDSGESNEDWRIGEAA